MSVWSFCICRRISIPVCYYRGKILCTQGNNTLNGKHSFLCWCLFPSFGFLVWLSRAKGTREGNNVVYMEPCPKPALESVVQGPSWGMATAIHSCPAGRIDWCFPISVWRRNGPRYRTRTSTSQRCPVRYLEVLGTGWCCHPRTRSMPCHGMIREPNSSFCKCFEGWAGILALAHATSSAI